MSDSSTEYSNLHVFKLYSSCYCRLLMYNSPSHSFHSLRLTKDCEFLPKKTWTTSCFPWDLAWTRKSFSKLVSSLYTVSFTLLLNWLNSFCVSWFQNPCRAGRSHWFMQENRRPTTWLACTNNNGRQSESIPIHIDGPTKAITLPDHPTTSNTLHATVVPHG